MFGRMIRDLMHDSRAGHVVPKAPRSLSLPAPIRLRLHRWRDNGLRHRAEPRRLKHVRLRSSEERRCKACVKTVTCGSARGEARARRYPRPAALHRLVLSPEHHGQSQRLARAQDPCGHSRQILNPSRPPEATGGCSCLGPAFARPSGLAAPTSRSRENPRHDRISQRAKPSAAVELAERDEGS